MHHMISNHSIEITRALVAERQATIRNEARQHQSGRRSRRTRWGHRSSATSPAPRLAGAPLGQPLVG
jgi:hypothetical protein